MGNKQTNIEVLQQLAANYNNNEAQASLMTSEMFKKYDKNQNHILQGKEVDLFLHEFITALSPTAAKDTQQMAGLKGFVMDTVVFYCKLFLLLFYYFSPKRKGDLYNGHFWIYLTTAFVRKAKRDVITIVLEQLLEYLRCRL